MRQNRRAWSAPLAVSVLLASHTAGAQQYGQWSWDGSLGGGLRTFRNSLDRTQTTSEDETTVDVGLGVSGFLVHPALGRFTLSGTAGLVSYHGARIFDSRRLGFNASVSALPQGRYPFTLYANRQAYSYSRLTLDDPLSLVGIPDTSTSYGGRLRLRSGPLRRTLFGYDQGRIGYRFARTSALQRSVFADWARGGRRSKQHLRFDSTRQEFGLVDYRIADLTGGFDQTATFGEAWRWEMSAFGVHRRLDYASRVSWFDNLRTSQYLFYTLSARTAFELTYNGGFTSGSGADLRSHAGLARLRLSPNRSWTVAPYAGYGLQQARGVRLRAPQAGLSVNWSGTAGPVDLVLSEGAGFTWLRRESGPRDSALSLSVGVTAGQGDERGLRKEAEASWSRNSLRRAGESLEALPDFGANLSGLGTEDVARGRLTLRRRLGTFFSVYGYGEASHRTFTDPTAAATVRPSMDSLSGTLQIGGRHGSMAANVGSSRVASPTPQDVRYWAASLVVRPVRRVSLDATYRGDRRETTLAPELDSARFEAATDVTMGALVLRGQVFQTAERPRVGPERRNRGVVITLVRRFGGWLPIVTGAPTGGTIQ